MWSTSPARSSRSTRSPAGSESTRSVRSLAGHGRRAVRLDLARHPVGDPDLEVGRGQLEAGVLGLEQDVGQDRQRAPVGHGATDDRQAARQVLLHDREFHVRAHSKFRRVGPRVRGLGSGWRSGCRGAGPSAGSRRVGSSGYLPSIFSSRHHRSNGVDTVDGHARRRWWTGGRPMRHGGRLTGAVRSTGRPVDDPAGPVTDRGDRPPASTEPGGSGRTRPWMSTTGQGFPPIWRGYPEFGVRESPLGRGP